jgi:hypothetical protein
VSTFVSTGTNGVGIGLAFGSNGNLYTTNYTNNSVYSITPSGAISTFATVVNVQGIAFGNNGDLYVGGVDGITAIAPNGTTSLFSSQPVASSALAFSAIPEPGTYALVVGAIVMAGCAGWRMQSRRKAARDFATRA